MEHRVRPLAPHLLAGDPLGRDPQGLQVGGRQLEVDVLVRVLVPSRGRSVSAVLLGLGDELRQARPNDVEERAVAVEQRQPRCVRPPQQVHGRDVTPDVEQLPHSEAVADGSGEQHTIEAAGAGASHDIDDDAFVVGLLQDPGPEPGLLHSTPLRPPELVDLGTGTADPDGQAHATSHAEGEAQLLACPTGVVVGVTPVQITGSGLGARGLGRRLRHRLDRFLIHGARSSPLASRSSTGCGRPPAGLRATGP